MFDMDGTVVQYKESKFQSTWGALGVAAGVNDEWDRLMNYYLSLPETEEYYNGWFEKNCKSLAGIPIQPILEKILPPPYTPGFLEFCNCLSQQGIKKGIISGGIDFVAEFIRKEASLDFVLVQELGVCNGLFTGAGKINVPLLEKGALIKSKLQEYNVQKEEAVFFGDNYNDVSAWREVGVPLGMNLKHESYYSAVQAHFSDFHTALKYLKEENLCPL